MTGQHPPPAPPRHAELGLGITTYTLHNGLRVVLVRDPRATEVQVTMRYGVGSVDDGNAPGIAHMAEHMMFQQVLGSETLFAQLEKITTDFNAETGYDATTYVSRAPRVHLDRLLSIEGVRLGLRCTSITDATFAREREVVVNEIRQRDDAARLFGALHAAAYPDGHPYRGSSGGSVETLAALTRDQVCAFVDRHYAPGNAVLVVSGDLTPEDLDRSLGKFIARVAPRDTVAQTEVRPVTASGIRAEAPAPIDDDALLVAWPLPTEPRLRTQVSTVASALPRLIGQHVSGRVAAIELGDTRAPVFAIVVAPNTNTTLAKVREQTETAIVDLRRVFGTTHIEDIDELAFNRVQQSAIYDLYASLEDGRTRDTRLATYVFEGRDPRAALAEEFDGIRQLTADVSIELASQYLALDRANIVTLKSSGTPRGHEIAVRPEIHDMGQRRSAPDLADAHRPAALEPYHPVGVESRQLPNGMRVVLLPTSTVPTVDIRLVFGTGTADEPNDKRGVAGIASHGLDWNFLYLNDLLAFSAAGGDTSVRVGRDHTRFAVVGVDMHLDYLLAGLRRWVVDGEYHIDAHSYAAKLRRAAHADRDRAVDQAWTTALFGASHPYALSEASDTITDADVEAFRRGHFTPDNATLVIAGHFDPALADRWIDYLFADWHGTMVPRATTQPSQPAPTSLALLDDLQQVRVEVALPTTTPSRAQQLVAARMLDEVAGDIRQKLGASYGVSASLDESRLAPHYDLDGWVDVARAPEVLQLFSQRLTEVRSNPDAAAELFIEARNRVLVDLTPSTPHDFATEIEREISLARAPLSTLETAAEVRKLTIDDMTAALADLDLSHATILVRGPQPAIEETFATLGRKPTIVERSVAAQDLDDDEEPVAKRKRIKADFGIALTDQSKLSGWTFQIAPAFVLAHVVGDFKDPAISDLVIDCCSGAGVIGEVGLHSDAKTVLGVRLGWSRSSGKRSVMYRTGEYDIQVMNFDVAAFARATGYDRLWGELYAGLHVDTLDFATFDPMNPRATSSKTGVSIGIEGGYDLLKLGPHRLGVLASLMGALPGGYSAFLAGVAYRR